MLEDNNKFINFGSRNKPLIWEYGSAFSFLKVPLSGTKFKIDKFFGFGEGIINNHAHHLDVIRKNNELMIKEFERGLYNENFFLDLRNVYVKEFKKLERICETDFKKDSNDRLAKKFFEVFEAIVTSHNPMLFALFTTHLDKFFDEKLEEVLKRNKGVSNINPVILKSIILSTPKTSFDQLEEDNLFDIEKNIFENEVETSREKVFKYLEKNEINSLLEKLVEKFGWFHMEYGNDEPFNKKDYKEYIWKRISGSTKDDYVVSPKKKRAEVIKKQEDFFKKIEKEKYFIKLIKFFQECAYILDDSKVFTVKGLFISKPLFVEVARRIGLSWYDMLYLLPGEIKELLLKNKKPNKELIGGRKNLRAVLLLDGEIFVFVGKEAKELAQKLLFKEKEKIQKDEVRGIVAFPGKVIGTVTLVRSMKDRGSFEKGDVLVTHDGTAELTIFLREASAIVTNEGGMICHAAIVARESETPCIVGTKNATKIFKSGDRVEVDADNGVVKKIN